MKNIFRYFALMTAVCCMVGCEFGEALGYMNNMGQDVHGASSQRADTKEGEKPDYTTGNSPQVDIHRIYNYVRVVRNIK